MVNTSDNPQESKKNPSIEAKKVNSAPTPQRTTSNRNEPKMPKIPRWAIEIQQTLEKLVEVTVQNFNRMETQITIRTKIRIKKGIK